MTKISVALATDQRGAIAILAAFCLPLMVGGLGLTAETGYWYLVQRKMQHAADLAATAGVARLRAGDGKAVIQAAALHVAERSGFKASTKSTLALNMPPLSGTKKGDQSSVEVILTANQPRFMTRLFSSQDQNLQARAVATLYWDGNSACVLALSRTADAAVNVAGSGSLSAYGCDVAANSNSTSAMKASVITANCGYSVGGETVTDETKLSCGRVRTYSPATRDPYANVPEPTLSGCEASISNIGTPGGTTNYNHPAGCSYSVFPNKAIFRGTVNLAPGLYYFADTFETLGGSTQATANINLNGAGVTFFFGSNATISTTSTTQFQLSAPTSGTYAGLVFFGTRSNTGNVHITGIAGSTIQGAVYFPSSKLTLLGISSTALGCTQLIADTITVSGNSTLRDNCATAGTRAIRTSEYVALSE